MAIKETIKGDLIKLFEDDRFDVIAHGANCFNIMGAGIAEQIAKRFPNVLADDFRCDGLEVGSALRLGRFSASRVMFDVGRVGLIFNLYCQYRPGRYVNDKYNIDSHQSRCDAIQLSVGSMAQSMELYSMFSGKTPRVGIPKIGCGISGLDWDSVVMPLIDAASRNQPITVVEYEPSVS